MNKSPDSSSRHPMRAMRQRREAERNALRDQESNERLRQRLAQQWAEVRAAASREPVEPMIETGPSNFSPAQVPWGVDLAAAWAWRFVVICLAGLVILWLLKFFAVIALPLAVALLIAALVAPVVNSLQHVGLPRKIAALLVVVCGIGVIGLLLTFVGQQVATGIGDLSQQVVDGLEEIRKWLRTGPLHVSDSQMNDLISNAQKLVSERGNDVVGQVSEVGTAVGHILAGFFIILFGTYFFLADGRLIWSWVVRMFPRAARGRADSSGRVAWKSLTQFVRATVLVAGTDAIGVMIWAAVLQLPFIGAIGVLVFLGAFVPMIGATLSGTVAVLVALVAKGPVVALIMLGGVIVVQQIEAHVLQPFLMGRFVSLHPLGVIVAIAAGVIVAGIAGALIAVPLAAALNSVVQHLAAEIEPDPARPDSSAAPPADPEDTEMPEEPDLAGAAEALVDPGSADPSPDE